MRELKFRALFDHFVTGKRIWLESTVNHQLKDIGAYVQISEWLQFTGLKDRNGKEIFEGDILSADNTKEYRNERYKGVFKVARELGGWGYEFDWENVSGYECSTHVMGHADDNGVLSQVEIIGNIYENADLLQPKGELV